jgi:integrase
MTIPKRWSFSAGARHRNRVRAFEAPTGLLFIEYRERIEGSDRARRTRQSLGHRDRSLAVRQLKAIAAKLAAVSGLQREITLRSLFDIYVREVTPRKGANKQQHDRRAAAMFLRFFGAERPAGSLNLRDWEGFVDARRRGEIGPGKGSRRVRDRPIEYDLSWLRAVFHWAVKAGRDGEPLLSRNPLAGYPMPRERSPIRSIVTEEQYQLLCRAAASIDWRLELALVLANETGHRITAIRHLQWSDIELDQGRIRWRAEHDKIGFEHLTPMSPVASAALRTARGSRPGIGDVWVLPASRRPDHPCPKGTLDKWFDAAAERAGLALPTRSGWHSLRRKFATELKGVPLRDLCYLGGWKDPKTLLSCYQQPDEEVMRRALLQRRPFKARAVSLNSHQRDTLSVVDGGGGFVTDGLADASQLG